jgi:hypothetical protein
LEAEGGGSDAANKVAKLQAQFNSRFQQTLDKLTPRTHLRWGIFAFVVLLYGLRVRLLEVRRIAKRTLPHPPCVVHCLPRLLSQYPPGELSWPPNPSPRVGWTAGERWIAGRHWGRD